VITPTVPNAYIQLIENHIDLEIATLNVHLETIPQAITRSGINKNLLRKVKLQHH